METATQQRSWALINAIALIATITVNALASILPLNGMDTGQLSDMYPNLFVPAGLTFSIWAVIYTLLIAFAVFSLVQAFGKDRQSSFIGTIGPWFLISSIANIAWIFAWHWTLTGLSLLAMLGLLASLLVIYLKLKIGLESGPTREFWLVKLPFSVYLGWITVATIANVTAFLVDIGWGVFGLSEAFWAALVIITGTAITIAIIITRRDVGFSFVVLWAFFGIYLKRSGIEIPPDAAVEISALLGMALIAVALVVWTLVLRKKA
jgi:hypothetical protein